MLEILFMLLGFVGFVVSVAGTIMLALFGLIFLVALLRQLFWRF